MTQPVRIVAVESNRQLASFLELPRRIYANDPAWVPPYMPELKARLDRKKNPYFEHAELQAWLAFRGDEPVGRISAQIDRLVPQYHGEPIGHMGFFEVMDDWEAASALFEVAENWLRERGMVKVYGPYNPTLNEEPGVLLTGLEFPPMMLMGHSRPWYPAMFERAGYEKMRDLYAFYLDIRDDVIPDMIKRLVARCFKEGRLEIRPISMRHYDRDLKIILDIFNDAWSGNWGYIPMTDAELKHTADGLKPIIREELTYIAYSGGRPVGMMVTLPNMNEIMKAIDGRLLPFGWAKLLWWLKAGYPKSVRVPLMGVLKEIQSSAFGAAVAFALIEQIRQNASGRGAEHAELSWILEDNPGMLGILEKIDSTPYKTYRVFGKALA